MTKRIRTWQSALSALVAEKRNAPFVFSQNDCATFAADCVKAQTGEDFAASIRGTYTDEATAAVEMSKLGTIAEIAAARLGREVPPVMAQVGDVVMVEQAGKEMFMVCVGGHLTAPGRNGLIRAPLSAALRAWRCATEG